MSPRAAAGVALLAVAACSCSTPPRAGDDPAASADAAPAPIWQLRFADRELVWCGDPERPDVCANVRLSNRLRTGLTTWALWVRPTLRLIPPERAPGETSGDASSLPDDAAPAASPTMWVHADSGFPWLYHCSAHEGVPACGRAAYAKRGEPLFALVLREGETSVDVLWLAHDDGDDPSGDETIVRCVARPGEPPLCADAPLRAPAPVAAEQRAE